MSNKKYPYLDRFLVGYWNQMASEIYDGARAAFDDFLKTEGDAPFGSLVDEIRRLMREGKFPSIKSIGSSYGDPFWSGGRILTIEDIEESCILI
jgi:hypothetical protein